MANVTISALSSANSLADTDAFVIDTASQTLQISAANIQSYMLANIGNIASINLNSNGSQVLAGNGVWVAQSGGGLPLANGTSNIDIAAANVLQNYNADKANYGL